MHIHLNTQFCYFKKINHPPPRSVHRGQEGQPPTQIHLVIEEFERESFKAIEKVIYNKDLNQVYDPGEVILGGGGGTKPLKIFLYIF